MQTWQPFPPLKEELVCSHIHEVKTTQIVHHKNAFTIVLKSWFHVDVGQSLPSDDWLCASFVSGPLLSRSSLKISTQVFFELLTGIVTSISKCLTCLTQPYSAFIFSWSNQLPVFKIALILSVLQMCL